MGEQGQQVRLHELRLRQRRGDLQERLTGEDEAPFGHGADLPVEGEAVQRCEVLHGAAQHLGELLDVGAAHPETGQVVEGRFEPGGDEEPAARRQVAHGQAEGGRRPHVLAQVRERHRDLVQIGGGHLGHASSMRCRRAARTGTG